MFSSALETLRLRTQKAPKEASVVYLNDNALEEALTKDPDFLCFGVKDTVKFPQDAFKRVRNHRNFLWLTVDRMSDKGRSIDTGLLNPLTYRPMTGSTSGGAVNILLGINDFALGTDGGGSILAPALSCQLPSFIGAGLGLWVEGEKSLSTDGMLLKPSLGVIAKSISALKSVLTPLNYGRELPAPPQHPLKVAIPERGCLTLPTGEDMAEKLSPFLASLKSLCTFHPVDMKDCEDRKSAYNLCKDSFKGNFDLLLTYEGPIDVLGYGETIPGQFRGIGPKLAQNGGKYLLKAANPAGCTALTVPSDELSCGFVIVAPEGENAAAQAFTLAEALESLIQLPEVFTRYYLTTERLQEGFKIFKNTEA